MRKTPNAAPRPRRVAGALLLCLAALGAACDRGPDGAAAPPAPKPAPAATCAVCGASFAAGAGVEPRVAPGKRVCSRGCAIRFETSPEKFEAR